MSLTMIEIQKRANVEATNRGYSSEEVASVLFDEKNSIWETSIMRKNLQRNPDLSKKLEGKDYIVFIYAKKNKIPNIVIEGGELYIFVEKTTGQILLTLSGK